MRIVVRAPNHLGDGVMAIPAIRALAAIGEVVVHAPRWGSDLYRSLPVAVRPVARRLTDGEVAVLLAPSLRAAWEALGACRRRIGTPTDRRSWLLTDRVPVARHTADTYRRLAEAAGAVVVGDPEYPAWPGDPEIDVPDAHLALNPLSATPETREWRGWAALAARQPHPVFYAGPGEGPRLRARSGGFGRAVVGASLPALASAFRRARVVVSADTGPAHFARAVGAPTLVVYGGTAPWGSGPVGADAIEGDAPCRPCWRRRCRPPPGVPHRVCLDLSVDAVATAVAAYDVR